MDECQQPKRGLCAHQGVDLHTTQSRVWRRSPTGASSPSTTSSTVRGRQSRAMARLSRDFLRRPRNSRVSASATSVLHRNNGPSGWRSLWCFGPPQRAPLLRRHLNHADRRWPGAGRTIAFASAGTWRRRRARLRNATDATTGVITTGAIALSRPSESAGPYPTLIDRGPAELTSVRSPRRGPPKEIRAERGFA